MPIVSIYESIGSLCNRRGIENLLVLGTMPTMTSTAFKNGLEEFGVKAFYPLTDELKENVLSVIEQLYQNNTDGASLIIDEIVRSCISNDQLKSTAVCLGCTELPLAFEDFKVKPGFEFNGVNYLNSTVVLVLSAFRACVS